MNSTFSSWWQKHWHLVMALIAVLFSIFILLSYVLGWGWVGMSGGDSKITITMITPGSTTATPATTIAREYPPAKTLWDWLGLLAVLAIPVVAGLLAAWFSGQMSKANDERNKLQHQTDLQIAEDQQRETALQQYLDKMSELLLHEKLRQSQLDDEVRIIARTRTWTVLRLLDPNRKALLFRFLEESNLISIIDLSKADLSGADLKGADLQGATLSEANLSGSDLEGANLEGADLRNTDLRSANLRGARLYGINLTGADLIGINLSGANLEGGTIKAEQIEQTTSLQGATMPDGSVHP